MRTGKQIQSLKDLCSQDVLFPNASAAVLHGVAFPRDLVQELADCTCHVLTVEPPAVSGFVHPADEHVLDVRSADRGRLPAP